MNKLEKYIVPIHVIVYGENQYDAISYVEDALDACALVQQDGVIGAVIIEEDIEPFVEDISINELNL